MSVVHPDISLTPNIIRIHDQAVRDWVTSFGTYLGGSGQKLNVVFASPERAFATLNKLLEKAYGSRAEQLRTAPYPYVSISRTGMRMSPERFRHTDDRFRTSVYSLDKSVAYGAIWPLAVDISYQLDFWSRTVDSADAFQTWFLSETIAEGSLLADFTPVWESWGRKLLFTSGGETTDNSILEADEDQRTVRITAPLIVKGWLPLPPVPVKTVLKVLLEYKDVLEE